ncbi:MFS transporter [Streptomyces sp. NPDC086777]|uniref:MFS transporter n=1 Tax=Streptomyces sp. NPDC086777 TaxID=3154866 RepID=UPI00344E472A
MVHTPSPQAGPESLPDAHSEAVPASGRHPRGLLTALLWTAQVLSASSVIAAFAQADVAQHFHTAHIAWFGLIYSLVGTLMTPFAVRLGDIFGKRRVMLALIALGLVGDVLTALAPTFGVLLVGRAVAACYAPMAALVFATTRDVLPPRRVGQVSGVIGATLGAVVAICPVIAGWLMDDFGFRGALWFVAAVTAVAFILVYLFLPETPRRSRGEPFDWSGGLLLGGSISALIYAIGQGTTWGWTDSRMVGLTAGALVGFVGFALVERAVAHPMMDVRMLMRPRVSTVLVVTSVAQGTAFAAAAVMTVVIPLYPHIPGVSDGLGWTAMHSALIGLPAGIVLFLAGMAAGLVTRRVDPRLPWLLGLALATGGLVLQAFHHHNESQIIVTGVVASLGMGILYASVPILVVGAVTARDQGVASGMSLMLVGLMTTVASQVIFTIMGHTSVVMKGTAFYRDAGYRQAYIALAAAMAFALLLSLFLPKPQMPEDA